jgi:DNA-binding MarR family transcriptional regulator
VTTSSAIFGQFGQALAFAERTMTATLREHLAQRGITPETWYALRLTGTRGPGVPRQELSRELAGSRSLDTRSAADLLARLEAEGLIRGDERIDLTAEGEALYRSLREYIAGPTARLLSQFDLSDVETTIRTLQAITQRAAEEASSSSAG